MTPRDARSLSEIRVLLAQAKGRALRRLQDDLSEDDRAGVAEALDAALRRDKAERKEAARLKRLYALEAELSATGYAVVAGIDEVGRGALAGPLTAGACVLPATPRLRFLNDSKMLTPARREELSAMIQEIAVCWNVAHVSSEYVDSVGMTRALRKAMISALEGLVPCAEHIVLDGLPLGVHRSETAVVGGDGKVASVAAASILAKVARDGLMTNLAEQYPAYGFDENKGYGTPEHLAAIAANGLSPHHRRSFSPCGGTQPLF